MNKPASPGKVKPEATESKPPKVSIVIPAYNREKYVGIAIKSVLDQTYRDLELIIVDDGSTDGTLAIAEQFAREDDRVRVITYSVNRGAAYALKAGFDAARGEYAGQVDSDDRLEALAVKKTAAVLDENPDCGMVYTNYIDIDKNGKKLRPGRRCAIPYSKERILVDFMTFHFRLVRKSIYNKIGGFNTQFNNIEDYDLCLRLSEVTNIRKINEYLYLYRFHPDSTKVTMNQLERIDLCKEAITQALQRRGMGNTHEIRVKLNPLFFIKSLESSKPQTTSTPSPIFVTGAPRSGTTLLRLLLTTHSSISIPPESLFFVALEPKYGNVGNLLFQLEDFLNDLYNEDFPKFREWNIDRELLSNNLQSYQELSYALAVETVYRTYCQQFNPKASVWGDKNPCHIHHVEKIWRHFPTSKIILIVRDFRACYSSMKNIVEKEHETKKVWTGPRTLEGMTHQWNRVVSLFDEYYQKNEQFYLVYYEELVREPVVQLTKICKWIGVDFQESMLTFYQRNAELSLVLPSQIVLNPNTFKPIDNDRIDAWQSELSLADVKAIELINRKSLEKLGYKCL